MARTAQQKVYADFRQGFVSVANPLAHPEGSLKDLVNFSINNNGTVSKRGGLRKEGDGTAINNLDASPFSPFPNSYGIKTFYWKNAGNRTGRNFLVVFKNYGVFLYTVTEDGVDFSAPAKNLRVSTEVNNPSFEAAYTFGIKEADVTQAEGDLYFTHPEASPFRLYLDKDDELKAEKITLKIRDLFLWRGATDTETGMDDKPQTMSPFHLYNLKNGGWPTSAPVSRNSDPSDGIYLDRNPIEYMYEAEGVGFYPSIYMPYFLGRAGAGTDIAEANAFSPWQYYFDNFGNTSPAIGRYILDAEDFEKYSVGYTDISVGGLETNLAIMRWRWKTYPTSVAQYAGRVWYAGATGYEVTDLNSTQRDIYNDLDVNNTIYFSQVTSEDNIKTSFCYQENDPTAEDINQLLPTDGGTLTIKGLGKVYKMLPFGPSLVVFSEQGIWAISGVDYNSFTADSYSVTKISNINAMSKDSIVETKNRIYLLAQDALYALTADPSSGFPSMQDISSAKIKDYYQDIPFNKKERSAMYYDEGARLLYVMYESDDIVQGFFNYPAYTKILVLDEDLGSFYKYEFPSFDDVLGEGQRIVGAFYYPRDFKVTVSEPVTLDGTPVTLDGDPVVLNTEFSTASLSTMSFLVYKFTEGWNGYSENDELFAASLTDITDFEDLGVPFDAYGDTGFDVDGDLLRKTKSAPAVVSHMEKTESGFEINPEDPDGQELILTNRSSCLLSYAWDWGTSHTNPQQLYRFNRNYVPSGVEDEFNYGQSVITTRNRIRGRGYSLGLRFEAEPGKDCRILGLGLLKTVAQEV